MGSDVCPYCGGYGQHTVQMDDRNAEMQDCNSCGGTGRTRPWSAPVEYDHKKALKAAVTALDKHFKKERLKLCPKKLTSP